MYETCIFDLYGTLVDIHTDEKKEELWEKLALFYAFYGAFYTPGELREAYGRLTEELSAGKRESEKMLMRRSRRYRSRMSLRLCSAQRACRQMSPL